MKKILLLLVMAISTLQVMAYDVEVDGITYNLDIDAQTAEVAEGNYYYLEDVVIPEQFEYEGVTYTVTGIGDFAFSVCKKLLSLYIPRTVKKIGYRALYRLEKMNSLVVDSANEYYCTEDNVLFDKDKTELIFCMTSKKGDYTVPNSVTIICEDAFAMCNKLTSVTMGDNVTCIDNFAFFECTELASVTMGDNVKTIGHDAFSGCEHMPSITLSKSLTTIDDYAFACCYGLTSLTLPESVETIGKEAFYGCSGLTSLTIGENVTSIGGSAFFNCTSLLDIYVGAPIPPVCGWSVFDARYDLYKIYESATLHVPEGKIKTYSIADIWRAFKNIKDDYVSSIETIGYDDASQQIFDLSGKRLQNARKGINIIDGRKVIVE